jgi:hypothetical protein
MNPEKQSLQEFEQSLQQLSPSQPSEALTSRIFSAFDTPIDAAPANVELIQPPHDRSKSWFQPFAAAAAVALIAGLVTIIGLNRPAKNGSPSAAAVSPVTLVPTHAQNTYLGSQFDDIIFTDDRRPLRAVRHQFTDTYTWENPSDGSRVEIQIPVERVRYVPVRTD